MDSILSVRNEKISEDKNDFTKDFRVVGKVESQ